MRGRLLRIALTLVVTGLCTAYILWQIDVGKAADTVAHARIGYLGGSLAIMAITVLPMAWRWQLLLAAKGVHDRFTWLTRA